MKTFQEFVSEMTYGRGRGPIGGADRNNSPRYRNLGSPTPEQEKENKSREDKSAASAVAKLRRARGMKEDVELDEESIDEIVMITPTIKKTTTKSQSKQTKDPYGEDPAVTRKRLAVKVKKLKEEDEIEEGIGMTVASALGNPPISSKRMKLKQALIINKIKSDSEKNKKKKYSGKAVSEENVQELFITKLTPEQKRKKKVETLIRLMQHAKDPAADVAKTKKEDYDIQEKSLSRVISKTQKGGIAIMSSDRGDKTNKEKNERSKNLVSRIRGAGLPGPTKVTGAYHEKDHGEQKEKSFVVSSGKMGKRKFKKTVSKLGQEGGLKHTRNQKPESKKDDQDSVLIKQKPGSQSKASWLGTSRRSDADPKLGKKYDQGKLSTKDANSPLKPGEGATIVGKKKMQFK